MKAIRLAWRVLPSALVAAAMHGVSATGAAPPSQGYSAPTSLQRSAPLSTTFPCGLTGPGTTDSHFSTALDLGHPLLMQDSGAFMAAARADARERLRLGAGAALSPRDAAAVEEDAREHLASASARRLKFMCSNVVHDREEVQAALRGHFGDRGQLALLLGGKSVGKSLLLGELAKRRGEIVGADGAKRVILYVDARSFGKDLAAGVLAAVRQEERFQQKLEGTSSLSRKQQLLETPRPQDSPASVTVTPTGAKLSVSLFIASVETQLDIAAAPPVEQCKDLIAQLAALVERQGYYLCLIVDEANLALPTPQDALPSPQLADTQQLLEKLVQLTKQTNAMNVLLVSSEYSYPYRLRHGRFFNTTNLTETIFAGEVPPAAMRQLLLHKWGLGPRLADVFLAYYGGHVHMAGQALAALSRRLDRFDSECVAPHGVLGCIVESLEGESAVAGGPMTAMLRALAEHGFAPVEREGNVQAQVLALANVGGFVTTSSTVVGLAEGLKGSASHGIVPSSHFVVRARSLALTQLPLSGLSPHPILHTCTHTQHSPLSCSATSLPRLFTSTRPLVSVHPSNIHNSVF